MDDNIRTITGVPPLTVENAEGLPLVDYKIYGNSEQRNLPKEYQEVEYLESTGTQYIDTRFKLNTNCRIVFDYYLNALVSFSPFGSFQTQNSIGFTAYTTDNNSRFGTFATGSLTGNYNQYQINNRTHFEYSKNGLYQNGSLVYSITTNDAVSNYNCFIFARNANNVATGLGDIRLYYFKIYDNDSLVRNLIPCYRKSDNKPGMYDTITETFFTNAGTGEFVVGADVVPAPEAPIEIQSVGDLVTDQSDTHFGEYKIPVKVNTILPAAYQEVEYLESTGTQYIDTLTSVSMRTNMEIKLMPTISTSSNVFPFSARPVANTPNINSYYANETINFEVGNTIQKIGSASMPINTENIIKFDNHKIYNNDVYVGDYSDRTITNTTSLLFFAARSNNAVDNRMFVGRLYYCKIYDSNTLVRDFIPCYRKSDNKPGLYDTITGTFLTNDGTGEFTIGPEVGVTNIYLDEPLRKVGDYADYIDFANQKVVRRVFEEKITSVDDLSGASTAYARFLSDLQYMPYVTGGGAQQGGTAVASIFQTSTYTYAQLGSHGGYIQPYITTTNANRVVYTFNDASVTTIAQAQALIGDGFEVAYTLATPTEETITLPEVLLEDGTNIIAVPTEVTPSNVELQYYLFVNKLYSENAVANIAKAIREKNGTANTYTIKEMAAAIRALNVTPVGEGVGE